MLINLSKTLILAIFFISGLSKFNDYNGLVKTVSEVGMPLPHLTALGAILIELIAPIVVMLSNSKNDKNSYIDKKFGKLSVMSLVVFTVLATYSFHNYFKNPSEYYAFIKNVSIIGGLLVLYKSYD